MEQAKNRRDMLMPNYLLMCRSLTYCQRAARVLERAGVTATVYKAPRSASPEGCTYCVKISGKKLAKALKALNQNGLAPAKILLETADHSFREVNGFE